MGGCGDRHQRHHGEVSWARLSLGCAERARGLQGLGPPPVLLFTCSSLPIKELGKYLEFKLQLLHDLFGLR